MNARQRAGSLRKLGEHLSDADLLELVARRGGGGADEYLAVLYKDIATVIQKLESKKSKYHKDDEEKLTSYISDMLERMTHNAECEPDVNGHVDLKVSKPSLNVLFLAEAKIHRSYPKNIKGMLQLLTRYASGKEPRGGFLLYIVQPGAAKIVETWQRKVRDSRLKCSRTSRLLGRGVFESHHKHSTGEPLTVRHWGVYMHYDPKDVAGVRAGKKAKKRHARRKRK